jgi:hypothetical protein
MESLGKLFSYPVYKYKLTGLANTSLMQMY